MSAAGGDAAQDRRRPGGDSSAPDAQKAAEGAPNAAPQAHDGPRAAPAA